MCTYVMYIYIYIYIYRDNIDRTPEVDTSEVVADCRWQAPTDFDYVFQ